MVKRHEQLVNAFVSPSSDFKPVKCFFWTEHRICTICMSIWYRTRAGEFRPETQSWFTENEDIEFSGKQLPLFGLSMVHIGSALWTPNRLLVRIHEISVFQITSKVQRNSTESHIASFEREIFMWTVWQSVGFLIGFGVKRSLGLCIDQVSCKFHLRRLSINYWFSKV